MDIDDELFERVENGNSSAALNHEIRMRANIKHINNLLAKDSGSESRTMLVESKTVRLGVGFGDHQLGHINDSHVSRWVWVEWATRRR